jgi:hypothetical protein
MAKKKKNIPWWKQWLTDPKIWVFVAGLIWAKWDDSQKHKAETELKIQDGARAYELVQVLIKSQQQRHPDRSELFDTITFKR